jgi:hypothetical protein
VYNHAVDGSGLASDNDVPVILHAGRTNTRLGEHASRLQSDALPERWKPTHGAVVDRRRLTRISTVFTEVPIEPRQRAGGLFCHRVGPRYNLQIEQRIRSHARTAVRRRRRGQITVDQRKDLSLRLTVISIMFDALRLLVKEFHRILDHEG